jgi:preprotein translocase subunit SecD
MSRIILLMSASLVLLVTSPTYSLAQLTIHAAADEPVQGWERMAAPDGDRAVWVAPASSLTAADIQSAEPRTGPDGRLSVAITFTEAGAQKMRTLSAAQMAKPIAVVLNRQLVWAPVIRSEITGAANITGGPNGLTLEHAQRIVESMNQKSPR